MKKILVKDLVEFRRKSDRAKKTFVDNIKSNKIETPIEGGGNYWISSISAVCNSYRDDDLSLVDKKIRELQGKLSAARHNRSKNMYQKNIHILQKYKSLDLKKLRPNESLAFLKKSTGNPLLTVKGLQIETKPSLIYTFGKKEEKVGAIWFTAKVDGYRTEEISIFCDMLNRFLKHNYSKKYQLISKYCVVVDMFSGQAIDYSEIEGGSLSNVLPSTLDGIIKLI